MPGLGDFLQNMFRPQQQPQMTLPASGRPGQIMRGPDGQTYQYAETNGMAGATGSQGWIPVNTSDPMQGMGPMDRLGYMRQNNPEALMGLAAGLMQGDLGKGFAAAGDAMGQHRQQFQQQQESQRKENLTKRWLMANKGLSDEEATMAMSNPAVLGTYLKSGQGQGYINAGGGNLFNSETGEWVSAPGGGSEGVAGLVPVWLQDQNGNPVLGQATKDGKIIRSEMPEGLSPVGPYQKGFETYKGQAEGKVVGEAAGALPGATQMAMQISNQVEDLKNDPYLPRMLGPIDSRLPNLSQDAARVQGKIAQLQGGAFLQARQMLKGGGAITDYEGQKAEQAFARLNQAQTPEDFKAALDDFNFFVQQGLQKLQAQAGQRRLGQTIQEPAQGGGSMREKYGLD